MTQYIAILARAWCNDSGCGIEYSSSLQKHASRAEAIDEGYETCDSDDFNVGVIEDGKLVYLDWMEEVVESDPEQMAEISEQICLEANHDN